MSMKFRCLEYDSCVQMTDINGSQVHQTHQTAEVNGMHSTPFFRV